MRIKGFLKVFSAVLTIFVLSVCASAEGYGFGGNEIENALPDEAEERLDELGADITNGGSQVTMENIFAQIWNIISENISKPLTMLLSTAAVIMLCAVVEAMRESEGETAGVFHTVGVLACSGMICTGLASLLESVKLAVDSLSAFLAVYIPAFAGIMAAGGQTSSASSYYAVVSTAAQVFSAFFSAVLFPLSSCVMGISIAGAADPALKMNNIAELAKKLVNWCLGFLMAIFTGLVSVQGLIAASADSASMKAVKFTVSSSVPIIGGSLSEALGTVKASLSLVKTTTGGFGIFASAAVMLPVFISAALYRLALMICSALSEVFGTSALTCVLKSGESVLAAIMAMMICYWLVAVVSTAFVIAIGGAA